MELKMQPYTLPEKVGFNYEELKTALQEKVSMYEVTIYTDDQIQLAKKDKASLNKLKKALNDERIRLQKEYLEPFNAFKAQIDELISIIDKPVALIDKQVKEFDEVQKQAKKAEIKAYFETLVFPDWVTFEKVFDATWLNKSISMKSIQGALEVMLESIEKDLKALSEMPEIAFEAIEVYKSTLDIQTAILEGKRLAEIQKKKAEQEAEQAKRKEEAEFSEYMNPPVEEKPQTLADIVKPQDPRSWVSFSAYMTIEEARQLKNFFDCRGIEYKAI